MPFEPLFVLAGVLSAAFSLVLMVAVVTYIRRTSQQIRAHDETPDERILDSLDQLHDQMYRIRERLDGIEARLPEPPPGADELTSGSGP